MQLTVTLSPKQSMRQGRSTPFSPQSVSRDGDGLKDDLCCFLWAANVEDPIGLIFQR